MTELTNEMTSKHAFESSTNPRRANVCVRCGRTKDQPQHEISIPEVREGLQYIRAGFLGGSYQHFVLSRAMDNLKANN